MGWLGWCLSCLLDTSNLLMFGRGTTIGIPACLTRGRDTSVVPLRATTGSRLFSLSLNSYCYVYKDLTGNPRWLRFQSFHSEPTDITGTAISDINSIIYLKYNLNNF